MDWEFPEERLGEGTQETTETLRTEDAGDGRSGRRGRELQVIPEQCAALPHFPIFLPLLGVLGKGLALHHKELSHFPILLSC